MSVVALMGWAGAASADATTVRGRALGQRAGAAARSVPAAPTAPTAPPAPVAPPTTGSSVPAAPVPFTADQSFALGAYWIDVPSAYDATHATPTQLLVWLHGCGGEGRYDIDNVAPAPADPYIAIAVGGREGGCWDVEADQAKVLAAIADVETHFNIDKRRIVLAGYSSGGDLSYRTAFYNATTFAGILVANTSPFRDTGSSASASIAAAAWKFPVVQLAHTGDDTYPIATVRSETATLSNAGFPVTLVERPGTHYDDAEPGTPGTDADIRTYLLPHLRDGWTSPG
jgi:predicted esterase